MNVAESLLLIFLLVAVLAAFIGWCTFGRSLVRENLQACGMLKQHSNPQLVPIQDSTSEPDPPDNENLPGFVVDNHPTNVRPTPAGDLSDPNQRGGSHTDPTNETFSGLTSAGSSTLRYRSVHEDRGRQILMSQSSLSDRKEKDGEGGDTYRCPNRRSLELIPAVGDPSVIEPLPGRNDGAGPQAPPDSAASIRTQRSGESPGVEPEQDATNVAIGTDMVNRVRNIDIQTETGHAIELPRISRLDKGKSVMEWTDVTWEDEASGTNMKDIGSSSGYSHSSSSGWKSRI